MAGGYVVKPSNGWYQVNGSESKVREADTLKEEFWKPVFESTDFKDFLNKQYSIGHQEIVAMDEIVDTE